MTKVSQKKIVLTAGHGGRDVGAINGVHTEADIAMDMRNIVAYILRADYGLTVQTDGMGKANLPLADAVRLARGADIAIEFHCNASVTKTATGIEALTTPKHKELAQTICQAVHDITGWRLRGEQGYKPDNSGQHTRLAFAQAGGVVFEPFFISNDADLALWYAKKWLICRSIASTIAGLASIKGVSA